MLTEKYNNQSSNIASYDYTDIAEGTGVVKFEGYQSETDSGINYGLTTSSIYSKYIESSFSSSIPASGTYLIYYDKDYDLTAFNTPKTLRGTAIIQQSLAGIYTGGSGTPYSKVNYLIRKWDGTTETEIASAYSDTLAVGGGYAYQMNTVPITIPRTHFKTGEILRLSVNGYIGMPGGGDTGGVFTIGHDPKNRDGSILIAASGTNIITNLQAYIPFELDV